MIVAAAFAMAATAWGADESSIRQAAQVKLQAKAWVNYPTLVFPDDRSYAVLFFSVNNKPKELEETRKFLEKLEKLSKRKDYFVLLLSPDKEEAVRRFVKREKIRFPVGAESKSHKDFKIDAFPQLILLERGNGQNARWQPLPLDSINSLTPPEPPPWDLLPDSLNETAPDDVLIQHARENPDDDARERAVEILRTRMPAPEFLKLCDSLLAEGDPARIVYGKIEYQCQLADPGVAEKRPRRAPSALAAQARQADPNDVRWTRINEYEKVLSSKSLEDLWTDFNAFMTDDSADLLIRMSIADHLETVADKAGARSLLMRMMPLEPDDGVRLHLVGSLMEVCEPGDLEAADFLEAQLAQEPNVLYVRPLMRTTIRYLRTGE